MTSSSILSSLLSTFKMATRPKSRANNTECFNTIECSKTQGNKIERLMAGVVIFFRDE